MAILQKLADLGFTRCATVKEADGLTTIRVRTLRGWVYEKFPSVDQVDAWSKFHKPEVPE